MFCRSISNATSFSYGSCLNATPRAGFDRHTAPIACEACRAARCVAQRTQSASPCATGPRSSLQPRGHGEDCCASRLPYAVVGIVVPEYTECMATSAMQRQQDSRIAAYLGKYFSTHRLLGPDHQTTMAWFQQANHKISGWMPRAPSQRVALCP